MGLLLGQVSKWRAQRADRCAHTARGFVGGATAIPKEDESAKRLVSMPHAALWVVQQVELKRYAKCVERFNAARGFVGGATGLEHYL